MQNLQDLETTELIDLLSNLTEQLTAKISTKDTGEIGQYEYDISMIQMELNSRNQNIVNLSLVTPNMGLTPGNTNPDIQ